jgi:hypothetical protein
MRPQVEEVLWSPPRVVSPLAQDPNFIKVGCHLGKYITAVVNTEAEQADIRVLRDDLNSASLQINVSLFILINFASLVPIWLFPLLYKIIEHSKSKDKFLKACLKRMYEAQDFEDELMQERAVNQMLLARNQELVAQLDTEW